MTRGRERERRAADARGPAAAEAARPRRAAAVPPWPSTCRSRGCASTWPPPHLDRVFEYVVPAALADTARARHPGQGAVRRAGRRRLRPRARRRGGARRRARCRVRKVVSAEPVLTPQVARLARAVADRWAGTLNDVLRLAIPARHARVEAEVADDRGRAAGPVAVGHRVGAVPRRRRLPPARDRRRRAACGLVGAARRRGRAVARRDRPGGRGVRARWPRRARRRARRPGHRPRPRRRSRTPASRAGRPGRPAEPSGSPPTTARPRATGRSSRRCAGRRRSSSGRARRRSRRCTTSGSPSCWDDGDPLHAEPRAPYPHVREVLALRSELERCALLVGGARAQRRGAGARRVAAGRARSCADRATTRARAARVLALTSVELAREGPAAAARLPGAGVAHAAGPARRRARCSCRCRAPGTCPRRVRALPGGRPLRRLPRPARADHAPTASRRAAGAAGSPPTGGAPSAAPGRCGRCASGRSGPPRSSAAPSRGSRSASPVRARPAGVLATVARRPGRRRRDARRRAGRTRRVRRRAAARRRREHRRGVAADRRGRAAPVADGRGPRASGVRGRDVRAGRRRRGAGHAGARAVGPGPGTRPASSPSARSCALPPAVRMAAVTGPRDAVDTAAVPARPRRRRDPRPGARRRGPTARRARAGRPGARAGAARRRARHSRARCPRRWRCAAPAARAARCASSWTRRTSDDRPTRWCSTSATCWSGGTRTGPFVGRLPARDVDGLLHGLRLHGVQPPPGRRALLGRRARGRWRPSAPEHLPALDVYVEHFADTLVGPVPGSDDLVRDLRALGVRLLGLTNWSAETFHLAEPAAPAIGLLEDVLVSGEVGVAKPDPRVFALLTRAVRPGPGAHGVRRRLRRRTSPRRRRPGSTRVLFTVGRRAAGGPRRARARAAAHLGSTPCDCSSPELPRPRCRRSRRSSPPVTRWSPCSPAPTPAPGAAGPRRRARSRRAPWRPGIEVLTPAAPARRGLPGAAGASSRSTRPRSSPTAR